MLKCSSARWVCGRSPLWEPLAAAGVARVGARRSGHTIERVDGDVEEIGVGIVLREAENQLGQRRRSAEAIEVEADIGPGSGEVEPGEGVEITASLDLQFGRSLDEEVERGTKSLRRSPRAASQDRCEA